jgi:hypothetical protein
MKWSWKCDLTVVNYRSIEELRRRQLSATILLIPGVHPGLNFSPAAVSNALISFGRYLVPATNTIIPNPSSFRRTPYLAQALVRTASYTWYVLHPIRGTYSIYI